MRCGSILLLVLLCFAAASCHAAPGTLASEQAGYDDFGPAASAFAPKGDVASLDDVTNGLQEAGEGVAPGRWSGAEPEASNVPPAGERMRIQRGAVHVEVARVEDAMAEFLAQVVQWGGYLSQQRGNEVTVRVPAAQFDTAFQALRGMGRVLDESREANDVTEQYVDLGIRLENAQRSRARLLELLARADKVEDILKIEEQVRRLSEEIERMEGQRRLLADQVAMSTLSARFSPVADAPNRPAGRPSRFPWIRSLGADRVLGAQ